MLCSASEILTYLLVLQVLNSLFLSMSIGAGQTRPVGRGGQGDSPPAATPSPLHEEVSASRFTSNWQEEEGVSLPLLNGERQGS